MNLIIGTVKIILVLKRSQEVRQTAWQIREIIIIGKLKTGRFHLASVLSDIIDFIRFSNPPVGSSLELSLIFVLNLNI